MNKWIISLIKLDWNYQGFTTEITLEKPIWMGYIKDYEGGTLMQVNIKII